MRITSVSPIVQKISVLSLAILLTACGGSNDGKPAAANSTTAPVIPPPTAPVVAKAATLSDCLGIDVSASYVTSYTDDRSGATSTPMYKKTSYENTTFNGAAVIAMKSASSQSLTGPWTDQPVEYTQITQDAVGITSWNGVGYVASDFKTTYIQKGLVIPGALQVGQKQLITISSNAPSSTPYNRTFEFEAVESLNIAGKTFPKVCRVKDTRDTFVFVPTQPGVTPPPPAFEYTRVWIAPGYGVVKMEGNFHNFKENTVQFLSGPN